MSSHEGGLLVYGGAGKENIEVTLQGYSFKMSATSSPRFLISPNFLFGLLEDTKRRMVTPSIHSITSRLCTGVASW